MNFTASKRAQVWSSPASPGGCLQEEIFKSLSNSNQLPKTKHGWRNLKSKIDSTMRSLQEESRVLVSARCVSLAAAQNHHPSRPGRRVTEIRSHKQSAGAQREMQEAIKGRPRSKRACARRGLS